MYLAEQGEISLDDPVKEYLPWFSLDYQGKEQELLVKDFLYQTTGVNPSTIGIIQPDQSDDALKR
jgi:CubicO group peptidase (beta-lactamase class C family)